MSNTKVSEKCSCGAHFEIDGAYVEEALAAWRKNHKHESAYGLPYVPHTPPNTGTVPTWNPLQVFC